MLRSDHRELRNSLVQLGWVGGGGWVVVGGMRANTETSRSSARARAATTMSIQYCNIYGVGKYLPTCALIG